MNINKAKIKSLLISVVASTLVFSAPVTAQEMKFWRIGTGGVGATYFPIGNLIASAISSPPGALACDQGGTCGVENLVAIAISTNASVANMNAVNSGQLDAGLAGAQVVAQGFNGTGKFAGKAKENLRAVGTLYREDLHLVLAEGLRLKDFTELNGLRIGVGVPGSGTQLNVKMILDHFGIEADRYDLNLAQSAQHLADDQIDAFFYGGGWPFAALIQLGADKGFDLYSFSADEIRKIQGIFPVYVSSTIPASAYNNIDYDVSTVASTSHLITSIDQPAELIYAITKALWDDKSQRILERGHKKGEQVQLESALDGLQIPLHPGAERFYKEAGMAE